jgi:hypothetical protein
MRRDGLFECGQSARSKMSMRQHHIPRRGGIKVTVAATAPAQCIRYLIVRLRRSPFGRVSDKSKPSATSVAGLKALPYPLAPYQEACVNVSKRVNVIRPGYQRGPAGVVFAHRSDVRGWTWSHAERGNSNLDERIEPQRGPARGGIRFVSSIRQREQ